MPISEAKVSVLDWGFLRSDATYDVVHVWDGCFFRLDHHLDRFQRNLDRLRLIVPHTRAEMVDILMRLVRLTGYRNAYVEVLCTRGPPPLGSRDPRLCETASWRSSFRSCGSSTRRRARGLNLHISTIPRIPPQSVDPTVKNYHWMDLTGALFEAYDAGCDLAVLPDFDGNLAEGPGSTCSRSATASRRRRAARALEGITARPRWDLLAELNVEPRVGIVTADDLRGADEAFITSTAGGIIPVTRIGGAPVGGAPVGGAPGGGEIGPVVTRLRDLYWERHGPDSDGTPIYN